MADNPAILGGVPAFEKTFPIIRPSSDEAATPEFLDRVRDVLRSNLLSNVGIFVRQFEEALERGKTYADSGADVLFIEAPATEEEVRRIPRSFSKPCLLNKAHSAPDLSLKTLEEMGYAIVIFPSATLLGALEGSFRMCKSLLEEGKQMPVKDLPGGPGELNQFFGLARYQELERKFS